VAGAWGSLRHALALREASGEPADRRLSRLALDIGTSFWSATEGAADHAGRASGARALHVNPQSAPAFVLTPPAGTVLVSNPNPNPDPKPNPNPEPEHNPEPNPEPNPN
jgi:hypothetical protein